MFEKLIVFIIVLLAVIYLAKYLFKNRGCGCGSGDEGGCCGSDEKEKPKNGDSPDDCCSSEKNNL